MSDPKLTEAGSAEKQAWQTPTIEELNYTGTEAIYNVVPSAFDGTFYTH